MMREYEAAQVRILFVSHRSRRKGLAAFHGGVFRIFEDVNEKVDSAGHRSEWPSRGIFRATSDRKSFVELTAYHEAGHAFIAAYLGATVRSVTIEPDDDDGPQRFGDTQIVWRRSRMSDRKFCENSVQVSLAGPVAEMLYSGDPYHPGFVAEWASDWRAAWQSAETLFADHRKRLQYLESITGELYRLMDSEPNWSAVAALADHLLAHETLEAEDVEEIVSEWLE